MNGSRRAVTRVAAVLATLVVLVSVSECSLLKREGVERAGPSGGSEGLVDPPPSPSLQVPDLRTLADWPDEPVAEQSALPPIKAQVIEPGYTGEAFLKRLAARRGITLKARQKIDFPGRPSVWHAAGKAEAGGTVRSIAAVWSEGGELMSVFCSVTASTSATDSASAPASAANRNAFLRECADPGRPRAAPTEVRAWLDGMVPRVDQVFATGPNLIVTSPLLRRGPTAAFLRKYHDAERAADTYVLRLFGTGDAN
ncbi:hypothetical protein [Kitasatospora sp. NPDC008115]|uniref:hypothetical protein n=1 Tax=Kitasatospora sp. NPDC008115 TaxID=3364022 RepID=UPI0036E4605D